MKKIMIFIPEIGYAGAENQTLYLAEGLDRNEFDVNLLTLDRGVEERRHIPDYVKIIEKSDGFDYQFIHQLYKSLAKLKPDLLHCISSTAYMWGVLIGRLSGVEKIVVSIWDEEWKLSSLQRIASLLTISRVDRVSVNSRGLIKYLEKRYKILGGDVWIINNGVESDIFAPREKDEKLLTKLNINEEDVVLGWVGNIRPEKDIETFLRASRLIVNENKGVKFLVIGEDREEPPLRKRIEEVGLGDRFIITGKVIDIKNYYNLMNIYVSSSLSEGMSNSLIEAQSSGLPSISTDVPGSDEIIEDGKTGFIVKKGDYEGIASKVLYLLKNRDILEEMGERARDIIPERFDMRGMVQNYEEFYREVISK